MWSLRVGGWKDNCCAPHHTAPGNRVQFCQQLQHVKSGPFRGIIICTPILAVRRRASAIQIRPPGVFHRIDRRRIPTHHFGHPAQGGRNRKVTPWSVRPPHLHLVVAGTASFWPCCRPIITPRQNRLQARSRPGPPGQDPGDRRQRPGRFPSPGPTEEGRSRLPDCARPLRRRPDQGRPPCGRAHERQGGVQPLLPASEGRCHGTPGPLRPRRR